jgi:hypothetical protein
MIGWNPEEIEQVTENDLANFFEGSEFVDKENRYPAGRDTVPARLNKGERVITTATNRQYYESLSAIHHHRIPAGVLNNFVKNWDRPQSILPQIEGKISFVGMQADNSEVKNELSQIKDLLANMTGTTVTVNANARGIYKIVERRKSQSQITNRIRKRA